MGWRTGYPSHLLDIVHVLVGASCNLHAWDVERRTLFDLAAAGGCPGVADSEHLQPIPPVPAPVPARARAPSHDAFFSPHRVVCDGKFSKSDSIRAT